MNPLPPIAFGYPRVSTGRQDLSLDAQTETIRRAAVADDIAEVEIFPEPDTSGSIPFLERPEAQRLLARIREVAPHRTVTLIVPKLDRIGRNTVDVSNTVTLLHSLDVRVKFLDLSIDTRTPVGWAMMQILAALAQLELSRIHERIQTALDHKRSRGELTSGSVPFGWDAVPSPDGRLTKGTPNSPPQPIRILKDNPKEQSWILQMIAWRNAGWGYHSIAKELNRQAVPTKTGAGNIVERQGKTRFTNGKWSAGKVHKLLNSRTVSAWLAAQPTRLAA